MDIDARLEEALRSEAPRARLLRLMNELLEHGLERGEIFAALESCRTRLSREARAEDEELILEMIDGFTGWCRID